MGFLGWTAAVGGLLLIMSLASGWISRGPVTTFGLYLAAGIVCGPWVLDLLHIDLVAYSTLTAHFTEIAMAASLFITGLKLRLPFRAQSWRVGVLLAFPAMLLTVLCVAAIAHYITGISWPLALALGAIIAPTDPVLASMIAVNDANDDDGLRVALSSEAGMNDGSALPILMLALMLFTANEGLSSQAIWHWAWRDVVWALLGGLAIGYAMGKLVGLSATRFHSRQRTVAPSDFLALALIALSYAAAQSLDASGFLAAFAAGVGLRSAEVRVVSLHPPDDLEEGSRPPPAEVMVNPHQRHSMQAEMPQNSIGLMVGDALSFGDTIERIFAAGIVMVLGITLAEHWEPMGLLIAALLFIVIRPLTVYITTIGVHVPKGRRLMIGWFGIRGIGSMNYIAYAWTHGLHGAEANYMTNIAFTVIVTSVVIHGLTVSPVLSWRKARQEAAREEREEREKQQEKEA
ncbi:cation:proton antiporter [Rahnella bonaserana]|jgi:NhaP-type Na+/H+ or K+/H+ antiporter|uniref:cation:proton antiporter n=1 Tax=Rahnella bonaserana TaxID=2816248 RepID=UPI0032086923